MPWAAQMGCGQPMVLSELSHVMELTFKRCNHISSCSLGLLLDEEHHTSLCMRKPTVRCKVPVQRQTNRQCCFPERYFPIR